MDLKDIRQRIDEIDDKLIELFIERMGLSKEVAEYKAATGTPILNMTREREILKKVCDKAGDMDLYAHRLYSTILELSRALQQEHIPQNTGVRKQVEASLNKTYDAFPRGGMIACQGTEGAYGQMAADRMFPQGHLVFFKTFEAVFDAVESGFCDFGVLPIENSSNGSVRETYDLLQTKNCKIVRSERLCIRHELMAKPGTKLSDIKTIISHEQAIGQCSKFLKSLGDKVSVVAVSNTAVAAEQVANCTDGSVAAIASHATAHLYGLEPVVKDIMDSDNNYTRFVCIAKDHQLYPGSDHIGLILALQHKPGALYDILAKMAALEVNLIKLESCPVVGHDFEFMFFFEMQANVRDPKILGMLEAIEASCEQFVYLGNYLEA